MASACVHAAPKLLDRWRLNGHGTGRTLWSNMSTSLALFLTLIVATSAHTAPDQLDRWLLDGHGTGRTLWSNMPTTEWVLPLPSDHCNELSFSTPFWGASSFAGLAARDGPKQKPQLAVPLTCSSSSAHSSNIWLVNPETGETDAFSVVAANSFDSYLKYLPDGNVVGGVNGTGVGVFDSVTLEQVYANNQIAAGSGGVQVIAVTKPASTSPQLPQIQTAGGTGGPNWWGSACFLASAGDGPSTPFESCQPNSCSTVNPGADGLSLFNNQRFESPQGVVRFSVPITSSSQPEPFNTGYQQWPWLIRSLSGGDVFAVDGSALSRYRGNGGHTRIWSVGSLLSSGPTTLFVSDDESLVGYANVTHTLVFDAASGSQVASISYQSEFGEASCGAMSSPWVIPRPIPLPGNRVIVVCDKAVYAADLITGKALLKKNSTTNANNNSSSSSSNNKNNNNILETIVLPHSHTIAKKTLSVSPDQVVADSDGNVYVMGTIFGESGLALQKVSLA